MPDDINSPLTHILFSAVTQLVMAPILVAVLKRMFGKWFDKMEANHNETRVKEMAEHRLTLAMARSQLLDNYERCIEKGYYTVDEREVYHELYEAYHKDGGNGIMDMLAEKLVILPTEPHSRDDSSSHHSKHEESDSE